MTDKQEIRAKSLELAINLIGLLGPFDIEKARELFLKENGKEKFIKISKGLNLVTDIFESIIVDAFVQRNEEASRKDR
jgi:hypothetical protein